jgi:hypothetical protein
MIKSLAAIRRTVRVGNWYIVTNYYLTNPSSAYYGTTRRTVTRVNENSFYMKSKNGITRIAWPKAAQVSMSPGGVISLYGGGAKQKSDELFLTLTPMRSML